MSRDHWVYVIADVSSGKFTGPVKVGISGNPTKRLKQIQTSCPFKVEIAYLFACPARDIAETIERSFHDTQRHHLSHGEWFKLEPVIAIHLLCLAFRAHLSIFVDPAVIPIALEMIGVLAAEKQFDLAVPKSGVVH